MMCVRASSAGTLRVFAFAGARFVVALAILNPPVFRLFYQARQFQLLLVAACACEAI
jgi:hypothetical protein